MGGSTGGRATIPNLAAEKLGSEKCLTSSPVSSSVSFEVATRPLAMRAIQLMVDAFLGACCYAYLVGEYIGGARVFTAPVAAPP